MSDTELLTPPKTDLAPSIRDPNLPSLSMNYKILVEPYNDLFESAMHPDSAACRRGDLYQEGVPEIELTGAQIGFVVSTGIFEANLDLDHILNVDQWIHANSLPQAVEAKKSAVRPLDLEDYPTNAQLDQALNWRDILYILGKSPHAKLTLRKAATIITEARSQALLGKSADLSDDGIEGAMRKLQTDFEIVQYVIQERTKPQGVTTQEPARETKTRGAVRLLQGVKERLKRSTT